MIRQLTAVCIAIALTVSLSLQSEVRAQRPNIVLINLDDADRDMFQENVLRTKFPNMHELAINGMTLTNFYVCSPKCGPSRACLFRGQYAHAINHRTNANGTAASRGFTGGFENFLSQGYYHDDFGKWMRVGGYETIFMGKYMNGFTEFSVPPGWDHFYLSRGSEYYETHRFTNRNRVKPKKERTEPGIYRTDAEVDDLVRLISEELTTSKPFLIYFAPFGPHTEGKASGGMVANELADRWPNVKPIRQADYNEKNNSDKPWMYRQLPPLTFEDELDVLVQHRKRMLAVRSIDDGIGRIVEALKSRGLFENTYLFITSDNGFSLGQHRQQGKGKSLTRSMHVPLIVAGPGIPRNSRRTALSSQIDLAPTFLDLADLNTKPFFDGKSLAPIIFSRDDLSSADFRDSLLVENWETSAFNPFILNTTFCQIRTANQSFTQWADGTREYYDLSTDPLELRNKGSQLSQDQVSLFEAMLQRHRRTMPEPICPIEFPAEDFAEITGPPFVISGVAEDSRRIEKVELVIRNIQTRQYWNGDSWQTARKAIAVTLLNPGGVQSEWSYSFAPPEPENPRESYVVTARAFSQEGVFNRSIATRRLKYDALKPVNVLKNVRIRPNGKIVLWGTATDNRELKHIEVVLQSLDTGAYFRSNQWSVERQSFRVLADESGEWEWVSPVLDSGEYVARIRAVDSAGNFEQTPQVQKFTVE